MKSVLISLKTHEDIKQFVNIASKYDYKIKLIDKENDYKVDAKSILGVLSLEPYKPVTVEIYSTSCNDFVKALKPYIV